MVIDSGHNLFACRSNVLAPIVRDCNLFQQCCLMMISNPKNVIVWLKSSIADLKGCSENLLLNEVYLFIFTPNVSAHKPEAYFPVKVSSWIVILISYT